MVILGCFSPAVLAGSDSVLTLEHARTLAQAQGLWQQELDLNYSKAELSLIKQKKDLGIGPVDSRSMRESIAHIDTVIEAWQHKIEEFNEKITAWEEELESLEETDPARNRLETKIANAEIDIDNAKEEIINLNRNRSSLEVRMYMVRDVEDQVEPMLTPYQDAYDSISDALLTQPGIIDYQVTSLYLSLLEITSNIENQHSMQHLLEKLLQVEKIKKELGLGTALLINEAEHNLKQFKEMLENLSNTERELKRALNRLIGFPVSYNYNLADVVIADLPNKGLPMETEPDLMKTVRYQRALSNLDQKKADLDDLTYYDKDTKTNKYLLAINDIELAEVELGKTIFSLESNYKQKKEQLIAAKDILANAELNLGNEQQKMKQSSMKYELGLLSLIGLQQQEISFKEVEIDYQAAKNKHYLAYQAYILARDGIELSN